MGGVTWMGGVTGSMHHRGERGAARAREPALLTSGARMAKRRQHRESGGRMPKRTSGEGHGQPRAAYHAEAPIAYAIGLPDEANVRRRGVAVNPALARHSAGAHQE
jgi:hypothetical protein